MILSILKERLEYIKALMILLKFHDLYNQTPLLGQITRFFFARLV